MNFTKKLKNMTLFSQTMNSIRNQGAIFLDAGACELVQVVSLVSVSKKTPVAQLQRSSYGSSSSSVSGALSPPRLETGA